MKRLISSATAILLVLTPGLAVGAQLRPSASPTFSPGQFTATGGTAESRCNHGRGIEVPVGSNLSSEDGSVPSSTTTFKGETVVAVGPLGSTSKAFNRLWAFTPECTLLTSFGQHGIEDLAVPDAGGIQLLAPASNGEILIGAIGGGASAVGFLGLMGSNGQMDHRFGSDGWAKVPWQGSPTAMYQEPSGTILIGGIPVEGMNWVGELSMQGAVEHHFGKDGVLDIPTAHDSNIVRIALEPDGDLVVVTSGGNMGQWETYPTELSPQGDLLAGFQKRFSSAFKGLDPSDVFIGDALPGGTGFVLIGTQQAHPVSNLPDPTASGKVFMFRSNGTLDTNFGSHGQTSFSSSIQQQVTAVPLTNGGILMVGTNAVVQESPNTARQSLHLEAFTGSGLIDGQYGVSGGSEVELPYSPDNVLSTLISSSASDAVVVVSPGTSGQFELDEFRL